MSHCIPVIDLTEREPANEDRRGLRPDVAAHVHDDWHEKRERHSRSGGHVATSPARIVASGV